MEQNNYLKSIDVITDLLRNLEGLTGTDAFEEVIKVFFTLNFTKGKKFTPKELKDHYRENVSIEFDFFIDSEIKLKEITLQQLINVFEEIEINSEDIKGRLFESFLGRVFTSGLGQFFTPREIVNFMVDYVLKNKLIPDSATILDPACGSGGILIKSFRENDKVIGFDINERLVRVAKMNMNVHGIKNFEIINQSFLDDVNLPKIDFVCTNPPFGVDEKQKEILEKFLFGSGKKSRELEILFIEKIINLLKPGGVAAIVVPDGILNNISLKDFRAYILKTCEILLTVDLPENVFKSTGTGCETSILLIRKKKKPSEEIKSFKVCKVDFVGFETQTKFAKKIEDNDLYEIIENKNYSKQVTVSELDESLRLDGKFYCSLETYRNFNLFDSWQESGKSVNKVYTKDEIIRYVQYSDIDPIFGVIKSSTSVLMCDAPNRAKIVVNTGDILIPKLKQSSEKIAIVTDDYDGCVVTNGFHVIKAKENVSNYYVFGVLRKKMIQQQLKNFSSGTIMPSIDEKYFKFLKYTPVEREEAIIHDKISKVFDLIDEAKLLIESV